jgi:hypothetical protein
MSHYWEEDHLRRVAERDARRDWRMPDGAAGIPISVLDQAGRIYDRLYKPKPKRDALEVLAEALTEARRLELGPARIMPDNTAQLPLFENEFERVCDDCGGLGFDPGALHEPEACPTCKGSGNETYYLGKLFQIEGRAA